MSTAIANGLCLHYALTGNAGPPLVLVHGSWGDRHGWDAVISPLAARFRVLAYDRRGHGRSECPPGQGSVDEDAADLAALIEHLDLAPAHVAGNSFGGSIALRLAARRPDLFRSLIVHEPPLFTVLDGRPELDHVRQSANSGLQAVRALLETGDLAGGARRFMDTFAFGPGGWDRLSPERQRALIDLAPTFLDELRDPDAYTVDLAALATFPHPVLVTHGDQSPPFYPPIVAILAAVLPHAELRQFTGAGHVPHASHPAEYAATVTGFIDAADSAGPA